MFRSGRRVIALAGRRIDAADSEELHFPLELVDAVAESIARVFAQLKPSDLVCSAACGVDLIALKLARKSGIAFHIVLPFDRAVFKKTSVEDRPGDWGSIYDSVISEASQKHRLIELVAAGDGDAAYSKATAQIMATAGELGASPDAVTAVAVTDANPRKSHDATAELLICAETAGISTLTIEILKGV